MGGNLRSTYFLATFAEVLIFVGDPGPLKCLAFPS
jgi:hypothetical protein